MTRGVQPVGPADAIRARVPDILRMYQETRASVLETGRVDPELKRLCARYLNDDPELADFERSDGLDERQRAALGWAQAIAWDPALADDALWDRLHAHFSEPELVELGYYMAIIHGQLHWLRTLGVRPDDEDVIAP
jgi:alkylhydroperoxidase family enzyme